MERCSFGRSLPAFVLLLLLEALTTRGVLGLRQDRGVQGPSNDPSYILHEPCPSHEGIGSSLKFVKPVIEVAQRQNLTYVCRADDFRSKGHNTGNLGFLFGCYNDSYVVGDMASYDAVKALARMPTVDARIRLVDSPTSNATLCYPKEARSVQPSETPVPIRPGHVYHVDQPGLLFRSWGLSYRWFRSQYHLVRRSDPARREVLCGAKSATQLDPKRRRVVLQIRKGDANRKIPTSLFVQLVDTLFAGGVPGVSIREEQAHVVVISESDENFEEFNKFKRAKVSFLVGLPERDDAPAQSRLVRDLDCMSSADVLVISSGGLGSLAAALQMDSGISLALSDTPDVASARHVTLEDVARTARREERLAKEERKAALKHEKEEMKRRAKEERDAASNREKKAAEALRKRDAHRDSKSSHSSAKPPASPLGLARLDGSSASSRERLLRLPARIPLEERYDGLPSSFVVPLAVQELA